MKHIWLIFFIVLTNQGFEKKSSNFRCFQRVYAKISALFNPPKIVPYQPKNSDEIHGFTPQMRKAIYKPEQLVATQVALIEIHKTDKNGKTMLHWIAQHGKEESLPLLEKLIELKADINMQSNNGYTPLMCAIHAPRPENIMQLLIEMRADITMRDKLGNDVKKLIAESNLIHDKNVLYALLENREKEHSCAIE